jgi:hypothetical protein
MLTPILHARPISTAHNGLSSTLKISEKGHGIATNPNWTLKPRAVTQRKKLLGVGSKCRKCQKQSVFV